ncbi:hypothetical protein TESG_08608 [Trichophyton tonsurans CBS 112818]|uniref:Uncharacterized protein n=2 Tax=Trichophyton TaxID=5550 RepID=F2Q5W8_TRIEC|nr:hypothetical protein TESG_08608 [Trichophyton tonsurans CBS 112818]EGE09536.1 hypothetical protein TEQG_08469 [Trichophyton equinum CBS 127.97]
MPIYSILRAQKQHPHPHHNLQKGLISTERLKRTVKLQGPKVHNPLQLATPAQRRASSKKQSCSDTYGTYLLTTTEQCPPTSRVASWRIRNELELDVLMHVIACNKI